MSLARIGYLILVAVVIVSVYYQYRVEQKTQQQVAPSSEVPLFSGVGLSNITYDADGVRTYVITSNSLEHFAKSGDTIFAQPKLKVFREGNSQEWQITAIQGVLDDNNVLTLTGDVVARNLLPDSGFDTLSTEHLSIQLENRDFWADKRVRLIGPQFETTGEAMSGNFSQNIAKLFNHVQGRYETLAP